MGCCFSRTASSSPPQSSPSSRNITAPTPPTHSSLSVSASAATSTPRVGSASRPAPPATENRPNLPLKPIDPAHRAKLPASLTNPVAQSQGAARSASFSSSGGGGGGGHATGKQWTRARLDRERADWWDTRTTGSPEIWAAYRAMVDLLQRGDSAGAQAVLDAVECTCPSGMLWRGIFDRSGVWYGGGEWVVVDPVGLIEGGDETDDGKEDEEGGSAGEGEEVGRVGNGKDAVVEGEEEELGEVVKVRCRLSSSGRDVKVEIRRGERVGSLVAKLREKAGLTPFTSLRLAYAGKLLDPALPLEAHPHWNYDAKHVLVALVVE